MSHLNDMELFSTTLKSPTQVNPVKHPQTDWHLLVTLRLGVARREIWDISAGGLNSGCSHLFCTSLAMEDNSCHHAIQSCNAHLTKLCHDCGLSSIKGLQVGGNIGNPLVIESRKFFIQLLQHQTLVYRLINTTSSINISLSLPFNTIALLPMVIT
ncbi:hypothetical protein E2C01_027956 [Portunus trituberculatus]|uniref:Uncharacterized protein n=1 Tax=Portunus trituberculatus TaxID=210409 RepID=A0A5B7ENL5_PORTR|nr:hypothetical protein [Portunus trituberculatus]